MPSLLKSPLTGSASGGSILLTWLNAGNILTSNGVFASTTPTTAGNVAVTDFEISLCSAVETPIGTNKASSVGWSTTLAYNSYGGATDRWGTTLTPTDIFTIGFGVLMKTTVGGDGQTNYLNATKFDWSGTMPTGAGICGILVEIQRQKTFNPRLNVTSGSVDHIRMTVFYGSTATGLGSITGLGSLTW